MSHHFDEDVISDLPQLKTLADYHELGEKASNLFQVDLEPSGKNRDPTQNRTKTVRQNVKL